MCIFVQPFAALLNAYVPKDANALSLDSGRLSNLMSGRFRPSSDLTCESRTRISGQNVGYVAPETHYPVCLYRFRAASSEWPNSLLIASGDRCIFQTAPQDCRQ